MSPTRSQLKYLWRKKHWTRYLFTAASLTVQIENWSCVKPQLSPSQCQLLHSPLTPPSCWTSQCQCSHRQTLNNWEDLRPRPAQPSSLTLYWSPHTTDSWTDLAMVHTSHLTPHTSHLTPHTSHLRQFTVQSPLKFNISSVIQEHIP